MALRPQWDLVSMGLTNSVHPYCKFATQAMQITPKTSCTHGFAKGEDDVEGSDFEFAFIICSPYSRYSRYSRWSMPRNALASTRQHSRDGHHRMAGARLVALAMRKGR